MVTPAQRCTVRAHEMTRFFMYLQISHSWLESSGKVVMLFLTIQMGRKRKGAQRYLPDTAVSLKMGDFNTPPVFSFSKRKRRLEICYFKTAVLRRMAHQSLKPRFFLMALVTDAFI